MRLIISQVEDCEAEFGGLGEHCVVITLERERAAVTGEDVGLAGVLLFVDIVEVLLPEAAAGTGSGVWVRGGALGLAADAFKVGDCEYHSMLFCFSFVSAKVRLFYQPAKGKRKNFLIIFLCPVIRWALGV